MRPDDVLPDNGLRQWCGPCDDFTPTETVQGSEECAVCIAAEEQAAARYGW